MTTFTIPAHWRVLVGNDRFGTAYAAGDSYVQYDETDLASAIQLTTAPTTGTGNALPNDARHAILEAENDVVRWRIGADPTASLGLTLQPNVPLVLDNRRDMLEVMRFIRAGATSKLNVGYFK